MLLEHPEDKIHPGLLRKLIGLLADLFRRNPGDHCQPFSSRFQFAGSRIGPPGDHGRRGNQGSCPFARRGECCRQVLGRGRFSLRLPRVGWGRVVRVRHLGRRRFRCCDAEGLGCRLAQDESLPIKGKGYGGSGEMLRKGAEQLKLFKALHSCEHFIVCSRCRWSRSGAQESLSPRENRQAFGCCRRLLYPCAGARTGGMDSCRYRMCRQNFQIVATGAYSESGENRLSQGTSRETKPRQQAEASL